MAKIISSVWVALAISVVPNVWILSDAGKHPVTATSPGILCKKPLRCP